MCKRGMFMIGLNEGTNSAMLFKARCKQWDCPDCAKINSDLWIMRATWGASKFIDAGDTIDMVTVTAHERHSVRQAVDRLPSQWDALRRKWQRECDKPQYMLTAEVGARGHFHIHFLTTQSPGTRFWKDAARSSGFGFMAQESERGIHPAKAGWYIGKYLAKQLTNNVWRKGFHRVRTSRGWPKLPLLPRSEDWQFRQWVDNLSVADVAMRLAGQGYSVALADERASWHFISTGELTEGCQPLTMSLPISIPKGR